MSEDLSVPQWDQVGAYLSWKNKVAFIAYRMAQLSAEPPIPSTELFENGYYIRILKLPKETFVIGRKHLKPHRMVLAQGSAILCAPCGKKILFKAPFEIDTEIGFQSVAFTLEDSIIYTLYKTDSRDPEALEAECFEAADVVLAQGKKISDQFDHYIQLNQSNQKRLN